jgi:hypothetical protein
VTAVTSALGARVRIKVSGHLCIKHSCDLVGRCGDLVRVASWRRQGLGRAGNTFAAGGGPRARRRSSGVGCPCPRLGSGEARSSPSYGPVPDLIAPIRPLQLYADGGYQLRIRSLEGTPNYGPRQGPTRQQEESPEKVWTIHCDGVWCHTRAGAVAIITSPTGVKYRYAARLSFALESVRCTNNIAEYEAVILGLRKL